MTPRGFVPVALLSCFLGLAAVPARAADAPLHIRQGWVALANILSPAVFQKKDLMRHYGTSYVLDPIHFAGTSPEITALSTGDVDIATMGFSTFATAVLNARLDDLRIIADGFQDGVDGYLSSPYIVRQDSGIATIEGLKGKVLADNAIGGALDIALRAMLRQHHLEDKRDYSIIEAQFPSMTAMLLEHKADLIASSPPFIFDPKLTQQSRTLFTMKEAVGPTQMIVFAARTGFLDKNRAALNDFFEDYLRGIHWFLDPAHHDEAVALVAGMLHQTPAQMAYLYTKRDYYHDPQARPNIAALQHDMATQRELGFLKTDFTVKNYLDLSFIDEAAKRLN